MQLFLGSRTLRSGGGKRRREGKGVEEKERYINSGGPERRINSGGLERGRNEGAIHTE